ncbi:MAG: hypothetical protein U0L66_01515 [Acutalibacteraceae bacterium]|nr:hypothetical protein [Acutalibacteraceae bacterium]
MIGIFNTISINSEIIYQGNDFTLQREYIYAAEYETCTGKRCADLVGWRYADLTVQWDTLPEEMLGSVMGLTGEAVDFTFTDELGNSITESVIPTVISSQATRLTNPYDRSAIWRNVSLQLRFINAHN